jgi:hypothetical protein
LQTGDQLLHSSISPLPQGLALEATLEVPHEHEEHEPQWLRLQRRLSGILSVSLGTGINVEEDAVTAAGANTGIKRSWYTTHWDNNGDSHAGTAASTLPRTYLLHVPVCVSCSETLAPWLALLPCRGWGGLGATVEPGAMFAAPWHRQSLTVSCTGRIGQQCDKWNVEQRFDALLLQQHAASNLQSQQLLHKLLQVSEDRLAADEIRCPVAQSSAITVQTGPEDVRTLDPEAFYNVSLPTPSPRQQRSITACVAVSRYNSARALGSGSLVVTLLYDPSLPGCSAADQQLPLLAHVTQAIPWFVRRTPGTLDVTAHALNGHHAGAAASANAQPAAAFAVLRPGALRGPPEVLAVSAWLAPGTLTEVSFRYTAPLLHAEDAPPDMHRGMDVPAAAVVVAACDGDGSPIGRSATGVNGGMGSVTTGPTCELACPAPSLQHLSAAWSADATNPGCIGRTFTGGLTVEPPSPDFSMPYNVMTLVMTAFAYSLGSMLNVTGRKRKKTA